MGFSVGKGLGAVATGGLSLLPDLLGGGTTTQDQVPLETPEQRAARMKLMNFANTGVFGNFNAGADIDIKQGNYDTTGLEKTGLSSLQDLLASGIPDQFRMGNDALASILNPDPNYIQSQFDPFKAQIQRQITDSNTALKRGAGFAGNLYSTNTIRGLGDIQARGNETLTAQLASLTNDALNRRLSAIPLAYQAGNAQENLALNRIDASQQYGGLERTLANAGTDAYNQELLRKRNELVLPINAATTVSGQNANFGVPSVTTQNPNPLMDVLNLVAQFGGRALGARGSG